MRSRSPVTLALVVAALTGQILSGRQESVDGAVIAQIRDEGLTRSHVGALFDMFVNVIGPRLTGSPEHKRAADWALETMAGWQLANSHLEAWPFGRGWALDKLTIEMVEPRYFPLIGYAEAWSPSTSGEVVVPAILVAGKSPTDLEAMQGTFQGAAVLSQPLVTTFIHQDRVQPTSVPDAPTGPSGAPPSPCRGGGAGQPAATQITAAIRAGGAAVLLRPSCGEHGTVFVQAGRDAPTDTLPKIVLAGEHYNIVARLLQHNIPVKLRVNVQTHFLDADLNSYNVIAEIPGVDPVLSREVVMIGAHLDSWHTGTGAADNADGAAAVMEAMRILKAIGVRPRRTLRAALWSGEEQGLYGSQHYVTDHLAGDAHKADRDRIDVYFNLDPGKGPIYGWYLEGNDAVKPIFDAWLAPFLDLGAVRNVRQGIGSTDHLSFTRAGIPGFNAIQDYVDYDVREHHTNADTAERVNEQDLKQNAIVLAAFAYHAAMRTEMIPSSARR
jgi:carboxypeptidase Q